MGRGDFRNTAHQIREFAGCGDRPRQYNQPEKAGSSRDAGELTSMPRTTEQPRPGRQPLVAGGSALMSVPARAQDPAVKDLLGKAQSQSETKAVEDLITKLKRQQPRIQAARSRRRRRSPSRGLVAAHRRSRRSLRRSQPSLSTPEKDAAAGERSRHRGRRRHADDRGRRHRDASPCRASIWRCCSSTNLPASHRPPSLRSPRSAVH